MCEKLPDDFQRFVIEEVRPSGENLTLVYGGRIFGGVVRCLLDPNGVPVAGIETAKKLMDETLPSNTLMNK